MTGTENQKPIHKDMMILQVVKIYPQTMSVFLESKLQCFSCLMSPFETVEEGALGHGWSSHDIEQLVERLNDAVHTYSPKIGH